MAEESTSGDAASMRAARQRAQQKADAAALERGYAQKADEDDARRAYERATGDR